VHETGTRMHKIVLKHEVRSSDCMSQNGRGGRVQNVKTWGKIKVNNATHDRHVEAIILLGHVLRWARFIVYATPLFQRDGCRRPED
jgi:hypothetical protein